MGSERYWLAEPTLTDTMYYITALSDHLCPREAKHLPIKLQILRESSWTEKHMQCSRFTIFLATSWYLIGKLVLHRERTRRQKRKQKGRRREGVDQEKERGGEKEKEYQDCQLGFKYWYLVTWLESKQGKTNGWTTTVITQSTLTWEFNGLVGVPTVRAQLANLIRSSILMCK